MVISVTGSSVLVYSVLTGLADSSSPLCFTDVYLHISHDIRFCCRCFYVLFSSLITFHYRCFYSQMNLLFRNLHLHLAPKQNHNVHIFQNSPFAIFETKNHMKSGQKENKCSLKYLLNECCEILL